MIRSTKNIYLLIMSLFVLIAFASFNYSKFNFTFLDGKEILERRFLRSGDSECLLVEARDAYAIYDCSNGAFLEGSLETNSPYYDVKDDKLYYYGLGNYYDSSNRITAFTKENSTYKDEEINKELNYSNMQDSSYVNELGYTMIKDSYYFENLTYFPTNYLKTCGLVALSILLAYYDTFYNDNFIDNDLTYLERIYEDENSFITNYDVPAINRVYREYSYDYSFDYQSIKDMPGASQSFHDYLFDNYLSTFILDKEIYTFLKQGYPIDAFNLAKIYSAYISKENNYIYNNSNYIADIIMYTHSRPKELINDGLPVILVLTSYKYKTSDSGSMSDEKFWHDIVAYGYKEIDGEDIFVANLGWGSSSRKYYVGEATIEGYFSINYSGEHVHSTNFYTIDKYTNEEVGLCPCGVITNMHYHNYIYTKTSTTMHRGVCNVCGDNFTEPHSFYVVKTDKICKDCGYVTRYDGDFFPIIFGKDAEEMK